MIWYGKLKTFGFDRKVIMFESVNNRYCGKEECKYEIRLGNNFFAYVP